MPCHGRRHPVLIVLSLGVFHAGAVVAGRDRRHGHGRRGVPAERARVSLRWWRLRGRNGQSRPQLRRRCRGGTARRLRAHGGGLGLRGSGEPCLDAAAGGARPDIRCSRRGIVAIVVLLNLRGLRESGIAFAIPTYAFILGIVGMIVVGVFRLLTGTELAAASSAYEIEPELDQLGTRHRLPRAPRIRFRLYSADRRRGDQQRRSGVPQAEVEECCHRSR